MAIQRSAISGVGVAHQLGEVWDLTVEDLAVLLSSCGTERRR